MTSKRTSLYYIGFAIVLLLIVNNIRSGVLVDTSFLPRFFLLAVLLLFTTILLARKNIILRLTLVEISFVLFYFWNMLSAIWATVPSEAIMQAQLIFVSLSVYLVVSVLVKRNPGFEKLFIAILLVALVFSYALAFYKMTKLEFFDPYRIISVSANNNLYSGFLLISLPLALAGFAIFSGFQKYLSVLVGILAVFFIVITQSRAVYLGLLFASLLLVIVLLTRYKFLITRKNLLVGVFALVLLLAAVSSFYHSLDQPRKSYFLSKIPVWQYFRSYDSNLNTLLEKQRKEKAALTGIPEFDFAGSYYENANLRVIFWKKSASLVASNPLLGVGAGNWRVLAASSPKPDNPDHIFKNYTYSQPHNEWICFVTELGIPGLLLAVILFIIPVVTVFFRIVARRHDMPVTTLIYASFLSGFYLFACFDFPFRRIEHNVILFSMLAFLMARTPMRELFPGRTAHSWKYQRFFLMAGLILTLVVAFMRIRGEYFTRLMFRYEGKDPQKVILLGNKAGNPFYRLTPNTLPLDWFIGVAKFKSGDPVSAEISFREALKITPYEVRVLNDHATAQYNLGRTNEAKAELQKTLAIDPFFDDARFNLAAIYYLDGESDSARILVKGCRKSQKKEDFLLELDSTSAIRSEGRH